MMQSVGAYQRPRHIRPPLDGVPNLTYRGVFSTCYRLVSSYTGPLLRVRRASDSSEIDIACVGDGIGFLDMKALEAHCTGTDGFVAKWYTQKGGADATNATAGQQPKIWDSTNGPLHLNRKVVMELDGSDDRLGFAPGFTTSTSPDISWNVVAQVNNASGTTCFGKVGGNSQDGSVWDVFITNTTNIRQTYSGAADRQFGCADVSTRLRAMSFEKPLNVNISAVTARGDFAALSQASQSGSKTLSLNGNLCTLGGAQNAGGSFTFPCAMDIACMMLFGSIPSADERAVIDAAMAYHYGD